MVSKSRSKIKSVSIINTDLAYSPRKLKMKSVKNSTTSFVLKKEYQIFETKKLKKQTQKKIFQKMKNKYTSNATFGNSRT